MSLALIIIIEILLQGREGFAFTLEGAASVIHPSCVFTKFLLPTAAGDEASLISDDQCYNIITKQKRNEPLSPCPQSSEEMLSQSK